MIVVDKLKFRVTFPPGGSHKRFIRTLTIHSKLSDAGRAYLAYIAYRYRRQWMDKATDDEFQWVLRWKNYG